MKTKLKVLFFIFLIVSVVTLVPTVNANTDIDISKLRIIKNKLIDKLGITKYQEIENNVSDIIDSYFIRFNITGYDLPMLDILKEIATIIVGIMVLLFGNNPIGLGLGSLTCAIALGLPVLLLAMLVTAFDLSQIAFDELNIDELIESVGIIGTCLICFILIPILIGALSLAFVVALPIVWVGLMQEIIWYAIEYV